MASTFTNNKDIERPQQGTQRGVWGNTVNRNFDKIDANLSRVLNLSIVANQVLGTSQSAVATSDAAIVNLSGDIGLTSVGRTLTFPSGRQGHFLVDTTEVTFGNSRVTLIGDVTDRGVTLTSVTDRLVHVYTNGTSVRRVDERSTANVPLIGEVRMFAPPGGVVVSANLPFGWHVANGNNGTVDLRNRFVRGASSTNATGTFGGSDSTTIDVASGGTVEPTVLTSANLPAHSHGIFGADASPGGSLVTNRNQTLKSTGNIASPDFAYAIVQSTAINPTDGNNAWHGTTQIVGNNSGGGAAHNHTFTPTATNRTVTTVPAFFSLVFIQFTGS